jgi:hypothetical protein
LRIDEVTRKDILKDIDPRTYKYSKEVKSVKYKGITKDYVVVFETPSVTANPPTVYTQRIKLLDYPDVENDTDITYKEKVRLAIAGDIEVSCTCPAYKWWGYEYIMTQLSAKEGSPQKIFPEIRNPELQGTVCKHLKVVIEAFVMNWTTIAKDIKDGNFI